ACSRVGCGGRGEAEAFIQMTADEVGVLETAVGGEDFAGALFFAFLGRDEGDGGAGFFPHGELFDEFGAGLVFGGEAVLGDERVGGKVAVMAQAVGVPGGLGEDRRGGGVEEGGGFVEVGQ